MQTKSVSRVGFLGVLGNLFLMLIKFISGFFFHSQAMIADGMNSLMDIFASFMTLMGGYIASHPRDEDHQFGHGKAEFLFALFVSFSMFAGAFLILKDAITGFVNGHEVIFSVLLFIVCILTIFTKLFLFLYSKKIYNQTKSLLVYSNMIDHRNDIVITCFTFCSVIFSFYHISWLDLMVGIGIAIWILISGIHIFQDSYKILMDHALDEITANKMKEFINSYNGVLGITKFETAPAGYQYLLILSILVDGTISTFESHQIADNLEKDLLKTYSEILAVTIHVNPTGKK
ncbi:MAG: cation transporter [Bacilli bacterium]|jgi:cation diffusion facilitator family transporter|nr:cation transporter [Bacilli bacterium]